MIIRKYESEDTLLWDSFLCEAECPSFLFRRAFMTYHHEQQFIDHSLLVFDAKNQLCALFPAHQIGGQIYSHQGLSYGGIILKKGLRFEQISLIFEAILTYYRSQHFTEMTYKQMPYFYRQMIHFEEDMILFRLKAVLFRQEIGAVVDWQNWSKTLLSSQHKRNLRKAQKSQLRIVLSENYETFWHTILIPNLQNRYHTSPTHSVAEILELKRLFPNNIQLFIALHQEQMVAGSVLFLNPQVVHAQYIASNDVGKKTGALSLLFTEILENTRLQTYFFSFGISTENQGQNLNLGLHHWKEGFGARAVPHHFYRLRMDILD